MILKSHVWNPLTGFRGDRGFYSVSQARPIVGEGNHDRRNCAQSDDNSPQLRFHVPTPHRLCEVAWLPILSFNDLYSEYLLYNFK